MLKNGDISISAIGMYSDQNFYLYFCFHLYFITTKCKNIQTLNVEFNCRYETERRRERKRKRGQTERIERLKEINT